MFQLLMAWLSFLNDFLVELTWVALKLVLNLFWWAAELPKVSWLEVFSMSYLVIVPSLLLGLTDLRVASLVKFVFFLEFSECSATP